MYSSSVYFLEVRVNSIFLIVCQHFFDTIECFIFVSNLELLITSVASVFVNNEVLESFCWIAFIDR